MNDIIRVYGKPAQIVVETARDLPMGAIAKKKLEKSYKENKDKNKDAGQAISEYNQNNSRENRFRYRLWKEQKETCTYSGTKIPITKLWTPHLEVDHILPWSKTLDNSFSNKVLVYKSLNQNKSDKTPYEFFSSDTERWKGILDRVKDLPKNKQWRFNSNAMEKFQDDEGGFLARQLNDTRYISKYAKKYLSCICKDIWTVRGQTTSIVRSSLFGKKETSHLGKNRNDHKNHAIDALVIGLIDRSFVQKISKTAKQVEVQNRGRLENIGKAIKTDVLPWASFEEDAKKSIDRIIVSHRKRTKREGQLHNETAYGVSSENKNFKDPIDVIHYKDILSFKGVGKQKIEKIISDKIRDDFLKELEEKTKISKEFIENYHKETGVRRVRTREKEAVIPIKDKNGKIYKAFQGGGNYAMRLFEKSNGKWDAEVISIFNANQEDFTSIPKNSRLMKNDILYFENRFWRLVKFDRNKTMIFTEHFVSGNPDEIRKNEETKDHVNQKSLNSLQKEKPKRVDISPCGIIKMTPLGGP